MASHRNFIVIFTFILQILLIATQEATNTTNPEAANAEVATVEVAKADNSSSIPKKSGNKKLLKYIVSVSNRYDLKQMMRANTAIWYFGSKHLCAGTILDPKTILTAAHCLYTGTNAVDPRNFQIIAKTPIRMKRTAKTVVFNVEKVILHPDYDHKKLRNDVALVILTSAIKEDDELAQSIKIADRKEKEGKWCDVVGWGTEYEDGPIANDGDAAEIAVLEDRECEKKYGSFTNGMVCAGDQRDPELVECQADGGSPIICKGTLNGIASRGDGCAVVPNIYMDVTFYRQWIDERMQEVHENENGANSANSINFSNILWLPMLGTLVYSDKIM